MAAAGPIILGVATCLVAAGGLFDLCVPALPGNLARLCNEQESARRLVRELLRALGGALTSIGIGAAFLVVHMGSRPDASTLAVILVLIVPAELINAWAMRRVGSPFYIPLLFALLTIVAGMLSWPRG
jgi:hypothetical protein